MPEKRRIIVIGGGASGLVAAIAAARAGARVCIFEQADRVGKKILATGNGRCNLTNMNLTPDDYNNPLFVAPVLEQYSPQDIRAFFEELGLVTFEEREGRVYPRTNAANSVLDVLRLACRQLGVEECCGIDAMGITAADEKVFVHTSSGQDAEAEAVVVATGGGTELLTRCAHTIIPFTPALCALETDTGRIRGLSGVRSHARAGLFDSSPEELDHRFDEGLPLKPLVSEKGEVLFRDYGVSGIAVFNLSRFVQINQTLALDLLPDMPAAELQNWLDSRCKALFDTVSVYKPTCKDLLCGLLHPRIATAVLRMADLKPGDSIQPGKNAALVRAIKCLTLRVRGLANSTNAQITRGGADLAEFNPSTLASTLAPNVYACGETLDVDGPCGGYNLQWAWASGLVAGESAALGR